MLLSVRSSHPIRLETIEVLLIFNNNNNYNTVSTKKYDKRDDFEFYFVNFPFLDSGVPRRLSYGVYFICFMFIYLNLFALPELLRMLVTLLAETNFNCQTP